MQNKKLIAIIYAFLLSAVTTFAQNNTLSIPDAYVAQGSSIELPVHMDNTSDVVAVQFTLYVPDGISVKPETAKLTERADGHSISMKQMDKNKYMALLFSGENKPFLGRTGKLLSVDMDASNELREDAELKFVLDDVVITSANGTNIATGYHAGKIVVKKSADLMVSEVTTTAKRAMPNEKLTITWQVQNIGSQATRSGWQEQVYLELPNAVSKLIGTLYYEEILEAGGAVSRTAEIKLPKVLGLHGETKIRVKVTPNSDTGESSLMSANNQAVSSSALQIGRIISLSPTKIFVEEKAQNVRLQLLRSGNTHEEEIFMLTKPSDSRVQIPEKVTIPKRQVGTYFYAKIIPNGETDADTLSTFSVSGTGYDEISDTIVLDDDTYPSLQISAKEESVREGESLVITVSSQKVQTKDLKITLTSDHASRFEVPESIVIPTGKDNVDVVIKAKEDDIPDVEQVVTFTAVAPRYKSQSLLIMLADNDVPNLEMELLPNAISEADGPLAVTAKLRRIDNKDKKITIKLYDNSDNAVYYVKSTIVMDKGVEEAILNLGPIDNGVVDGERTVNISAAVYIASCSCNASAGNSSGIVTAPLTIYDNDGPTLSLSVSSSLLKEGGEIQAEVSRNTNPDNDLIVTIGGNQASSLVYPQTVTIPAGKKSATFTVKAEADDISGNDFTAMLTVDAEGYSKGSIWFAVSDQTLPDARISAFDVSVTDVEIGAAIQANVTLENSGSFPLPELTTVNIYAGGDESPLTTIYLQSALGAGASIQLTKEITLPNKIGVFNLYAVANESKKVKELIYTNNSSQIIPVKTVSPFKATVQVEKDSYNQGDSILISGVLTGNAIANNEMEIYVINDGHRQTINTKTDANGNFSIRYLPFTGQIGHFSVGACCKGEGLKDEMASFDVYGLKRTDYSHITCDVVCGDTQNGKICLKNPGNLSLSGVSVEILSVPESCEAKLSIPSIINAGQEVQLSYSLKGITPTTDNKWEEIKAKVNTHEGVSLDLTLYFYCRNAQAKLVASTQRIVTTMNKEKGREYCIQVTNIGRGNTGKISLALPDFIKSLAGKTLPSISQNDTLTIPLSFLPTEDMQLNVPVTGQFGINCENNGGMAVNFSITPVSDETGTLVVDVCNEYTYYTSEAPHVEGAEVVVRNPVTGALVTQGRTTADGLFTAVLPEGYYKLSVTANNHDTYSNNVLVDPGVETRKVVNLSAQAITVDWKVEETEIEDEYEIVTTVKYETNVPEPVVELVVPKTLPIDSLAVGESIIFYAVLTNKGLITAKDAELILPEGFKRIVFEPLSQYQELTIAPQQSVSIPVKVTRVAPVKSSMKKLPDIDNDPCVGQPGTLYFWDCGLDRKWHRYGIAMQLGSCRSDDPSTLDNTGNGGSGAWTGGWPYGTGISGVPNIPGGSTFGSSLYQGLQGTDEGCEPCQNRFLYKMVKCITGRIPVFKGFWEIIGWIEEPVKQAGNGLRDQALDRLEDRAKKLKPVYGWVKRIIKYVDIWGDCINPLFEPCDPGNFNGSRRYLVKNNSDKNPSYIKEFQETLDILTSAFDAEIARTIEIFGDSIWIHCDDEELSIFTDMFISYAKDEIDLENLRSYKPQNISNNQLSLLIERWNNTINNIDTDNKIDIDKYDEYGKIINSVIQYAIDNGYPSMMDMYEEAEESIISKLNDASKSVCASVTLQFKQTMTMTRQAFRGTLTVFNGNETTAMTEMKLTLNVSNRSTGEVATAHEFQINAESLDGFTGELSLGSGWKLEANETGTATILFIPTKYAAQEEPVEWSFGGKLSYIDPFSGLEVTRELYPVTLTVNPSPELDLTYFMQRDVFGDDALTSNVTEPMIPAEFALLINNKGNGDARNVQMVTQQPEIIENEKGLYIDFELISSQVNGNDAVLSFGQSIANDFGTIPAHSQMYAQWWLTSSLLGHFTDYDVKATHLTSYGNPDLSLLGEVTIHELIRSLDVDAASGKMVGFMANDQVDANDMPDVLYLSNGEVQEVNEIESAEIQKTSDKTYTLTIKSEKSGWVYGNIKDPTYGRSNIQSVIRQRDGKEISLRNFWQTDRTLRDGKDPLYENRMHFADEFTNESEETYIITFEPTPDVFLEVDKFEGVPTDISFTPLDSLKVHLNKKVDPKTFTTDDITVTVQGKKQNVSLVEISTNDNKTFTLDLSKINESSENGYYTLTVQTTDITDTEGYNGRNGKSTDWIMFREGFVKLSTAVYPHNSGSVTKETGTGTQKIRVKLADNNEESAKYGSTVILTAIPNEGYEFSNWTLNGEIISEEERLECHAINDMDVKANFVHKKYEVKIETNNAGGEVAGCNTGIYSHGDTLTLVAHPYEDYAFESWSVNGEVIAQKENLKLNITEATTIVANFVQEIFEEKFTLYKGWNWVSSYLESPLPVADFIYIDRVLGQYEENIYDAELGMVGNIDSIMPGTGYKIYSTLSSMHVFKSKIHDIKTKPITLKQGWNWISYPFFDERILSDVVTNAEDGDYLVSQNGFSLFENGYWEGSDDQFIPGAGYLYKSVTEKTLEFDFTKAPTNQRKMSKEHVSGATETIIDIRKYPHTMNIVAQLSTLDEDIQYDNYLIYAMVGNECRGVGQYIGNHFYITVYGDSMDNVAFVVENVLDGKTVLVKETLEFQNEVIGNRNTPFILNVKDATGINAVSSEINGMDIYNVNGTIVAKDANVKTLRKLQRGVYIINGQKYIIK